jgi:hypothetical protein
VRILVNDKPVDSLTPRLEQSLLLAKAQEAASGAVMNAAQATAAYIGQTRRWFMLLGSIAIALMLGIAVAGMVSDPIDGGPMAVGALIIGGAFVLIMVILLRRCVGGWNAKLARRSQGLAPAGTAIGLDAAGLRVGAESFAWPSLQIEQIELTQGSLGSDGSSSEVSVIERLSLSAGKRTLVLDRTMLSNGLVLVDNAWRRLRTKPTATQDQQHARQER